MAGRVPVHVVFKDNGFLKRELAVGGCAKGIPRKISWLYAVEQIPEYVPFATETVGA